MLLSQQFRYRAAQRQKEREEAEAREKLLRFQGKEEADLLSLADRHKQALDHLNYLLHEVKTIGEEDGKILFMRSVFGE